MKQASDKNFNSNSVPEDHAERINFIYKTITKKKEPKKQN